MSKRDIYHYQAKNALKKDGWLVTDDPLISSLGEEDYRIDLGAEKIIIATKENKRIAVEVKSFLSNSVINDFHKALGQILDYKVVLEENNCDRELFMAITEDTHKSFLKYLLIKLSLKRHNIKLLVFDPQKEEVIKWIN